MNDVYYKPENYGLKIVDTYEADIGYEFDMVTVWEDESGALFWAADSGCSCPSPFEDYNSKDSLTPLTAQTFEPFEAAVKAVDNYSDNKPMGPDKLQFVQDIRMRLR